MIIMKREKVLKGVSLMSITYTKIGDYQLPNLYLKEKKKVQLGKYSMMKLDYLKKHQPSQYQVLVMEDKLTEYLNEIENTAQMRVNLIMDSMMKQENINEEMKANDQMKWVGLMNNIKNIAEEMVLKELIYN